MIHELAYAEASTRGKAKNRGKLDEVIVQWKTTLTRHLFKALKSRPR